MWIQKIRLKNIKSYGEGAEGQGVTIYLEPGVNQIAGKNGAGKSTLIEAIGYALFDAEPVRGNSRIAKNTYLLRNGTKSGEIDIWVWHQDCLYRVERDVGNGGRRWKIVRDDDDFIEAEGDKEVKTFLADIAGVDGPERLAEVFHSLLGVKQGRFTIPFDLKPTEAKSHFDPLLDVDIFRQCFDYLKEPCDEIRQDIANQRSNLSGLEGQIAQLQDAPERLEDGIKQAATLELLVKKCQKQLINIALELEQHDNLMNQFQSARLQVGEARGNLERVMVDVNTASARVEEARQANEVLARTRDSYEQYLLLEKQISALEKQRNTRDGLVKTLTSLQREETGLARDLEAKMLEAARERENAKLKTQEQLKRQAALASLEADFKAGEARYLSLSQRAEELKNQLVMVVQWLKGMSTINKQAIEQLTDLEQNLKLIDSDLPKKVTLAREAVENAERNESECRARLERTKQDKVVLEKQLMQLSTGQCPLLGTECAQFNPEKARGDLAELSLTLEGVSGEHQNKLQVLSEAKGRLEKWLAEDKKQAEKLVKAEQLGKSIERLYDQLEDAAGRVASEKLRLALQGAELPRLRGVAGSGGGTFVIYRDAVEEMKELQMVLYGCYQQWQPEVEKLLKSAQETQTLRAACGKEIEAEERALQTLAKDIQLLGQNADQAEKKAGGIQTAITNLKQQIEELELKLQPFAGLEERLTEANKSKSSHLPGYTQYLQNFSTAEKMEVYLEELDKCNNNLKGLQTKLTLAEQRFKEAEAAYCLDKHKQSKDDYARANLELGEAKSKLAEALRIVEEQRRRAQIMGKLQQQRSEQIKEIVRLQAQEKILEKSRHTLKNAQELVARNLTSRVAAQAQLIYNSMSQEAAQFNWRSGDYSLNVATVSGEKRFASLSGGQQMKAALAMQLALVKEFSTAGFCAFDEPTYGLDAESRTMLAEAIAKAQEECRFEQLLLVSHDHAFDDKVEYALNLQYSPVEGTKL